MNYPKFTAKELEAIDNLDTAKKGKQFGLLQVKNYFGKNRGIVELNDARRAEGKLYMGHLRYDKPEKVWYFYGKDDEAYRIPEPQDGIDSLFEAEFKVVRAE